MENKLIEMLETLLNMSYYEVKSIAELCNNFKVNFDNVWQGILHIYPNMDATVSEMLDIVKHEILAIACCNVEFNFYTRTLNAEDKDKITNLVAIENGSLYFNNNVIAGFWELEAAIADEINNI